MENGMTALSLANVAKLVKVPIQSAEAAVLELRHRRFITGRASALCLTPKGEEYALQSKGFLPVSRDTR
jgi:hypothetical protein